MKDKYDISGVSVGDTVATTEFRQPPTLWKVERLTTTQIVCNNGIRFNRESGRRIGSSLYEARAFVPTPEDIDNVKRSAVIRKILAFRGDTFSKLDLATLNEFHAKLLAASQPKDTP